MGEAAQERFGRRLPERLRQKNNDPEGSPNAAASASVAPDQSTESQDLKRSISPMQEASPGGLDETNLGFKQKFGLNLWDPPNTPELSWHAETKQQNEVAQSQGRVSAMLKDTRKASEEVDRKVAPRFQWEDYKLIGKRAPQGESSVPGASEGPGMTGEVEERRVTIDDMINRYTKPSGFVIINDPQGDTWIFIDPPPRQPEQDRLDFDTFTTRCSRPHVMKRSNLLKLHSPSIASAFSATSQFRVLRRRKLVGKLPESIKYVIDLTPPTEGDEAAGLMTSLCCPEGARLWFLSNSIWQVSWDLVGGKEEYISSVPMPAQSPQKAGAEAVDIKKTPSENDQGAKETKSLDVETAPEGIHQKKKVKLTDTKPASQSGQQTKGFTLSGPSNNAEQSNQLAKKRVEITVPEYSPIRHHTSIERILAIAQGLDPNLDSAPKIWTTFAVAKYFEVADSPLTDYIVRWLRAPPNSFILEVLPEVCLTMVDFLQVYDLTRDTFAILVGEEALASFRQRKPNPKTTVFGRKKEMLPEPLQNRLEYAAKDFTERMMADMTFLNGPNMAWVDDLPELQRLSRFQQPELQPAIASLKQWLKEYVRGAIGEVLCSDWEQFPESTLPENTGEELVPRVDHQTVWYSLTPQERIFTQIYWKILQWSDIFSGPTNFHVATTWCMEYEKSRHASNTSRSLPWTAYRVVYREDLGHQINHCRTLLRMHYTSQSEKSQESSFMEASEQPSDKQQFDTADRWDFADKEDPKRHKTALGNELPGLFNLEIFFNEAFAFIKSFAARKLGNEESSSRVEPFPSELTTCLLCLDENEFKYLPLWAGGNDDGSNGVFSDDVPLSQTGFATAGPGVHTGTSSRGSSEYEFANASSESDFNTSTMTNAGFSDELQRNHVYAADSIDGLSSRGNDEDGFSFVTSTESFGDSEERQARHNLETLTFNDEADATVGSSKDDNEDYDDVFDDDDDDDSDGTIVNSDGENE